MAQKHSVGHRINACTGLPYTSHCFITSVAGNTSEYHPADGKTKHRSLQRLERNVASVGPRTTNIGAVTRFQRRQIDHEETAADGYEPA